MRRTNNNNQRTTLAMRVNGSTIMDILNLNDRARLRLGPAVHLLEPPLVMELDGRVAGILALFKLRLPLLGSSRKRRLSHALDRLLRIAPWPTAVLLGQVGLIFLVVRLGPS